MSRFVLTAQLQLQAPNNVAQVVRQIQSQLNNVSVNVQVQGAAQAQRQLQQVTAQTQAATSAVDRMGRAFAVSVRRFAAFSIATRAVGLFTSTLSDAIKTAIDFEREMVRVSQVTGESLDKLKGFSKTVTDLSTSLGVASSDLVQAGQLLLQAGISAKDTEVALKTLAKAALAPNFDSLSETTEGAIAILAQFGQGVGALEKQLGSINAVAGAFAVEAGDLIDVIRRAGGVFKSSGGELNELIALFTSVRATTRESAESIGTGLRTIFTRIQRPKTIEFLKQFGVELLDLEGKFVGPFEAVKRLSGALAGLGEGDVTFIRIAEELGGFRQIGKVLPLLQQFTVAQNALNVANKAGNSLTKDAETAQQALAVRIIKVKEEFLALIRGITETKTFQIMANTALSLASALIQIGEAIKPLLPMLATLAAVNLAKGIGPFLGSFARGMSSNRTFNKGGKVHHFARGGMVPGTGNRDTVPAMLQPGEFVIRKSSVNKLGAGNLAAMNENRYALGGKVGAIALNPIGGSAEGSGTVTIKDIFSTLSTNNQLKGGTSGNLKLFDKSGSFTQLIKNRKEAPDGITFAERMEKLVSRIAFNGKKQQKFITRGVAFPSTKNSETTIEQQIKNQIIKSYENIIPTTASLLASSVGLPTSVGEFNKNIIKSIGVEDAAGKVFEGAISSLGAPFDKNVGKQDRDSFDFPLGIGSNLSQFKPFADLQSIPTDAKKSLDSKILNDIATRKTANTLSEQVNTNNAFQQLKQRILSQENSKEGKSEFTKPRGPRKKHFGGIIQKFAKGGMAQAPLIDDIVNATGTMMPRPSSAISALIRAGGGAIDIDRTIKRTLGDKAYGSAKTSGQQSAALDKFFRDPQARLRDVTSAPLTTFGKELQTAIKSGQLSPGKLSIISKSQRVPGVAEYLSRLFGIPLANMIFTSGGSKQPAMDALRNKGPRANRVARFAAGGDVGTDTVPALLTPGEFVINRSSAQRIGYGNLNRMNKVGRYAKGGVVQRFAQGTTGTGAKPKGDVLFQNIALNSLKPADKALTRFILALDDLSLGGFFQLGKLTSVIVSKFAKVQTVTQQTQRQLTFLNSVIPGFSKAIEDNSKANRRSGARNADLVTAIYQHIADLFKSGASQQQLAQAANKYVNQLNQNTALLQKGASVPQLAGVKPPPVPPATPSSNPFATMTGTMGAKSGGTGGSGGGTPTGGGAGGRGAAGMISDNKMFAASMAASLVQGFLPAIEENSSATLRLTHSFLGLVTTITSVGFALEAFGVKLGTGQMMDFLGGGFGKGKKFFSDFKMGPTAARVGNRASLFTKGLGSGVGNIPGLGGLGKGISGLAGSVGKAAAGFTTLLGPLVAIAGSAWAATEAFKASIEAIYNFEGRLKSSIEKGDIEGAKKVAGERATFEGANVVRGGGATAGAIVGFFLGGPIGAAIGSAIGAGLGTLVANLLPEGALDTLNVAFGGNTRESAIALAAAQAGAVKTQKELDKAQKTATMAMEDFENGSISASEALSRIRAASSEVINQEKRATDFAQKNLENRAGGPSGVGRNILSAITFGMVESSAQRNERLGKESADQIRQASRFSAQAFEMETGARTAAMRTGLVGGVKTKEQIRQEALGVGTDNDLQKRLAQQVELASTLQDKGDKEGAAAARDSVNQLTAQINQVNREMENLAKEVARAKAAADAMNLGLRGAGATSSAMSATMDRFMAGFEVGGNMFVADVQFLSKAVTSAAQAMNPEDIKKAITNVSDNLRKMGVSAQYITKFEGNTAAFVEAQQKYGAVVKGIVDKAKQSGKVLSPDDFKKQLNEQLTAALGPDVSESAKQNLKAMLDNLQLSNEDIAAIQGGNTAIIGEKLGEAVQKQYEELQKIGQERNAAEQNLIKLTQQRIEAERNLVNAQREAVDLYMEGREVQAKYGGQAVSMQERRGAILAKANAGAARMGLGQMRTGSVAELRARNNQILTGFGGIEARRGVQGSMQAVEGANAAGTQQDLQQAQKDQVQTIRDLIKLEEEELKIIQEKNKLEKDSLESLITGDIEKFFEQQAAVGAQAAIATGDTSLANMFGAKAIGTAFQDIQRMQEAGVQSLFGRQLAGPGGLTEQAAGAALGARGVMDPRMAQRLAGTTAEEEAIKGRLRDLGGVLGETGAVGAAMAEMQVQTANIVITSATLELQKIEERGRQVAESMGLSRGGVVYANRGIFVPRGTDTVPAMLTPGEFVVRREAVNRGNNLQLLRAINNGGNAGGFARGGKVGYYNNGGMVQYKALGDLIKNMGGSIGISPQMITNLGNVFTSFTNSFNESIKNLQNTKLQVKLDSVNVNVNLNGTSMLSQVSEQTRKEIVGQVIDKLKNEYGIGNNGKFTQNTSNLARPGQGA